MRNLWKVGALGAVFGAVLGVGGCQDFDAAYEDCKSEGRCEPRPDGGSDAGDGGDGGEIVEPEPTCTFVSDADEPDPEGRDLNCDGVDGVAAAGYFVDPVRGSDTNEGTQLLPLLTLNRALEMIRATGASTGRTHVYLGVGTYNEPETVVTTPVSLHGGYKWNGPGDRYWSRFKSTTPTLVDGGTLAFTVRDVTDAGVLLDGLDIISENASAFSQPSIALRVIDSGNVVLRHMSITAGNGAPGRDGADGAPGQGGGSGSTGTDSNVSAANGGGGGTSACEATRVGGRGGKGVPTVAGDMGADGGPDAGGGRGGTGGPEAVITDAGCNDFECSCNAASGSPGLAGAKGNDGAAGNSGTGDGEVTGGLWVAGPSGEDGKPGKHGTGGGGGGAGGSCNANATPIASGGGGGGGGGAGCGGQEGRGGGNGGASIALLVTNAQVTTEATTTLKAGQGGGGGRGGAGGGGGAGGDPGAGGKTVPPIVGAANSDNPDKRPIRSTGGTGGLGGSGGMGGNGGTGGGGRGGPSVVTWCANGGVVFDAAVIRTPGTGGAGGVSDGGIPGTQGLSELSVGCPVR